MTNTEFTINYIKGLKKGTVLSRQDLWDIRIQYHKETKGHMPLLSFDQILAQGERFGVERVISYRDTINSKYSAMDVVNLIKAGHSIEDVEAMLHTKTKQVSMRIL